MWISCDIMEDKEYLTDINWQNPIPLDKNEIPSNVSYTLSDDSDKDIVTKSIIIGIQNDKSILIKWPKWTGKTSVVSYIAQELNRPLLYMQLNWTTSVDEFIWFWLIENQSTFWVDWILAKAMKYWYILVLDELNMAPWDITAILHSVMDDRKILVQATKWWNVIKAHPDFRIVATINPSDEWGYTWTKEMNESLVDRFKIYVESSYPDVLKEVRILESKKSIIFSDLTQTFNKDWKKVSSKNWVFTRMCLLAKEVRESNIDYNLSTRNLIDWAELSCFTSIIEAYQITFENKMDSDSRKEISSLVKKYFTQNERINKDR